MTLSLCFFMLFVVPPLLSADAPLPTIDSNTLHNVFGYPDAPILAQSVAPLVLTDPAAQAVVLEVAQAIAVRPINFTVVDEQFVQSTLDYDKFDWVLTKRVAASSNENFLLSPLGLKLALAILTEAATGVTQAELANVLGFELNTLAVRQKFSTIINSLESQSSQYVLNLGSRIYLDDYVHPQQRFAAIAEEFYKTQLVGLDFSNTTVAANEINSWVANKTAGNIKMLVNPDDLGGIVAMVLTTIYFKGTWCHQFPPNNTRLAPFYISPKAQAPVPYMHVRNRFYYSESVEYDAKILRLPYMGNKFSMYLIVPNTLTGLPRVLNALNAANLRSAILSLKESIVDVTIPKFHFDYTSVLDSVLQELGIRQAFQDLASFPGIARGHTLRDRIKISKVLQRSGIEVNELGSEAYSATEISLENKFGEDKETILEVLANKPFLFFIQDEATRQLLFTGQVADPLSLDGAFKFS